MESSRIPGEIRARLKDRAQGWTIAASKDSGPHWTVRLEHPASSGMILETGATAEDEAINSAMRALDENDELRIVAAAPPLDHQELCLGVRTLALAFQWDNREARSVAFLMYEHGHLTERETAWLSGYVGANAPGQAVSPLG